MGRYVNLHIGVDFAPSKQAFHIHRQDNQIFAFAGLWEQWQHETETLYSCTIITSAANQLMLPIHDRMPVIISQDDYPKWLDKSDEGDHAFALLGHQAYDLMTTTPVSDWVNNPQHDNERCLQ